MQMISDRPLPEVWQGTSWNITGSDKVRLKESTTLLGVFTRQMIQPPLPPTRALWEWPRDLETAGSLQCHLCHGETFLFTWLHTCICTAASNLFPNDPHLPLGPFPSFFSQNPLLGQICSHFDPIFAQISHLHWETRSKGCWQALFWTSIWTSHRPTSRNTFSH